MLLFDHIVIVILAVCIHMHFFFYLDKYYLIMIGSEKAHVKKKNVAVGTVVCLNMCTQSCKIKLVLQVECSV